MLQLFALFHSFVYIEFGSELTYFWFYYLYIYIFPIFKHSLSSIFEAHPLYWSGNLLKENGNVIKKKKHFNGVFIYLFSKTSIG